MLKRIDPFRVQIDTLGMETTLFASEDVFLDTKSVEEIITFSSINKSIDELRGNYLDREACINRCILTPDFHRGAGIPIGTVLDCRRLVIPKAVGSDIGCGMRLIATDITADEFNKIGVSLDTLIRYIFFEGGRGISLSENQRRGMFLHGVQGLLEDKHDDKGIWKYWDQDQQEYDIMKTHLLGAISTSTVFSHDDYMKGSSEGFTYDSQIGSIGGGNHFVEIQRVDEIFDGATSRQWGLKKNTIAVMVHTGSVSIGHNVGNHFTDVAYKNYPKELKNPECGFFVLPDDESGQKYMDAMANAANFAYVNRLFLGLMVRKSLSEALKREVEFKLVYDAPHNMVWRENDSFIHRKGACPAPGPSDDIDFPAGHPVIIPGSMGSSSYVLRGHGLEGSLCSACHGAGRLVPRKRARTVDDSELESLRIITKVDPKNLRPDIANEYKKSLMEEAPSMYKDVIPIIDTVIGSGIASKVARLWPLMTIKGI